MLLDVVVENCNHHHHHHLLRREELQRVSANLSPMTSYISFKFPHPVTLLKTIAEGFHVG